MDLVRDLLDEKVVDRHGREMGRVDDIILEIQNGAPPRVSAIELGPRVVARRLHPALGRWAAALEHALGIGGDRPLRIPFARLTIRHAVTADLAFGETAAATVERRLRAIVGSIPGSS
jgi:sporulation protein YlmC with PRC-barrel domain